MKQPHFKYYWDGMTYTVVEANVRTNKSYRRYMGKLAFSIIKSQKWEEYSKNPSFNKVHRITREQVRRYYKSGISPV